MRQEEMKEIEKLGYAEWCKKNKIPQDTVSRQIFRDWEKSILLLQEAIDDIVNGYIESAYQKLGNYLKRGSHEKPRGRMGI